MLKLHYPRGHLETYQQLILFYTFEQWIIKFFLEIFGQQRARMPL
ncbi:MAG: hypothetical protein AB1611_11290 [bacterium]